VDIADPWSREKGETVETAEKANRMFEGFEDIKPAAAGTILKREKKRMLSELFG